MDYIFSGIKKENPIKENDRNELQDQPNIQKLEKQAFSHFLILISSLDSMELAYIVLSSSLLFFIFD